MYKNTSRSMQHYTVSRAINSRANREGIDSDVLKHNKCDSLRLELVDRKKDLEIKIGKLTLQIKIAKDRHWRGSHDQLDFTVYERMEQQRANLLNEIRDIDKRLTQLKMQKVEQARPDRISSAFVTLAKEMLAEPIFNRIMVAALHRAAGD